MFEIFFSKKFFLNVFHLELPWDPNFTPDSSASPSGNTILRDHPDSSSPSGVVTRITAHSQRLMKLMADFAANCSRYGDRRNRLTSGGSSSTEFSSMSSSPMLERCCSLHCQGSTSTRCVVFCSSED